DGRGGPTLLSSQMCRMSAGTKAVLREAARSRREAAHASLKTEASARIASHFLATVPLKPASSIAGYAAIGSEADPTELLARLAAAGHSCLLPRIAVRDAPLVFARWRPGDPLAEGPHGTREPLPDM